MCFSLQLLSDIDRTINKKCLVCNYLNKYILQLFTVVGFFKAIYYKVKLTLKRMAKLMVVCNQKNAVVLFLLFLNYIKNN